MRIKITIEDATTDEFCRLYFAANPPFIAQHKKLVAGAVYEFELPRGEYREITLMQRDFGEELDVRCLEKLRITRECEELQSLRRSVKEERFARALVKVSV